MTDDGSGHNGDAYHGHVWYEDDHVECAPLYPDWDIQPKRLTWTDSLYVAGVGLAVVAAFLVTIYGVAQLFKVGCVPTVPVHL